MKKEWRNKWADLQELWAKSMEIMTRGFSRRTWMVFLWSLILCGSMGCGYRIYWSIWGNSGSSSLKIHPIDVPALQEDFPNIGIKPKAKKPNQDLSPMHVDRSPKRLPKDSIDRTRP